MKSKHIVHFQLLTVLSPSLPLSLFYGNGEVESISPIDSDAAVCRVTKGTPSFWQLLERW